MANHSESEIVQCDQSLLFRRASRLPPYRRHHLAAICLQVGRPKDHDRISRFIQQGLLDAEKFGAILRRHGLFEKWSEFQQMYPQP